MNKKIKLKLFVTLIVIAVGFLANTASLNAQTEVAECDKATLYGAVFVGTYPRNAWFEWGTTSSLGQSTQKQLFYTNSSYSDTISPLNENTTYYWRAVSREVTRTGTGSTDYGNILSFRTPRCGDDEPGDVTATATATATATETVTCSDGSIKSGTATASASASATARTFEQAHAIALQRAYDIALANARTQARTIANSKCLIIIDDDDGERPDVTTRSATSISRTGARLNGRTSGNGLVTRSWFEYGRDIDNLNSETARRTTGSGTLDFTESISGLREDTTYYFRAVAENDKGMAFGNISSFRTDEDDSDDGERPDVTTRSATNIGRTSATLRGEVDGNGSSTRVWFEYGTSRNDLDEETHRESVGSDFSNFSERISGLDEDTTYYFRAVAENNEGEDRGSIFSFRTDEEDDDDNGGDEPDVTTRSATSIGRTSATLNGRVDGNGSSTRVWFEYGTSRNDLDEETDEESTGRGERTFSERITGLRRDTTYYFRAVAENNEGEDRGSIFSFRTDEDDDDDSSELIAVTTPATLIFSSSAQLNALILSSGSDDIEAWFEWGPTPNMTGRTNAVRISSGTSVRHLNFVTGLAPGVTYYFRAIAENSETRSIGVTLTFTTPAIITPPPTTPTTPPVVVVSGNTTRNNLVMLTIDGGSEFITANEQREYKVEWENISNQTLRNVVLRVLVPESMDFEVANAGIVSQDGNTLSLDIGNLEREEEGELSFLARTKDFLRDGETLVVVANLVYTDRNDTQNDVLAYATHTAYANGEVLGASVFSAGFLPNSLFEWLLLIIFILILALLGKHLINQNRPSTSPEGH